MRSICTAVVSKASNVSTEVNPRLAALARGHIARAGVRATNLQNFLPPSSFALRGIHINALKPSDGFAKRHNSPTLGNETELMVETVGFKSLDELIDATVPKEIRRKGMMDLGKYSEPLTESEFIKMFKTMASKNKIFKSYIGMGYYNTHVPPVIARNLLENPGWYTQYTPYQAEIAQGRLESLFNFQTMVSDLTGMPMSNSSLLDEGTAAAEAMTMCSGIARGKKPKFLVSDLCHPQTIEVCATRADGLGLELVVANHEEFDFSGNDVCGVLLQYPATNGSLIDYSDVVAKTKAAQGKVVMACDLLALTMTKSAGECGADIAIGSAQRFGVPMGYGGPHAAFLATSHAYKRQLPGRIIGMSVDAEGKPALRMAMQTREQHIRRDKATSNICTAQALLANISAMYAVYHGPEGLKQIAQRVHGLASMVAIGATKLGHQAPSLPFFDTVTLHVGTGKAGTVLAAAAEHGCNLRMMDDSHVSIALDETTELADVDQLFTILALGKKVDFTAASLAAEVPDEMTPAVKRESTFLQQSIFNTYHSEHEMLRYLKRLESRDLSLCHSMIALGSCTMKLNGTTEMMPISWPELANIHPFAPLDQCKGYLEMFDDLAAQLCTITGFDAMSLQPNSGATGEYAGLMAIRAYHHSRGDHQRDVCIIPVSAHGTNPASAAMCGMKIVVVGTDALGNISIPEVKAAAEKYKDTLAALMVTYPSTHGVYEDGIDEICNTIHEFGGQVYMDGANMNAQVGLTSPGLIGADVCHLNLHKTFCIPHGGGGPAMGPIGVKKHLAPFMPTNAVIPTGSLPVADALTPFGAVAAAPFGSALILPISYAYIALMGSEGLTDASKYAILNANYMAKRLEPHYPILFRGKNGTCAHEFIIDLRPIKDACGIEAEDVSKRLMDYGYHSPTMSWPVTGTLMVEPTESESKGELDRFCNAMIAIRQEIQAVQDGKLPKDNNMLTNAPHPAAMLMSEKWDYPYTREEAAYPAAWTRNYKFWPTNRRIDNVFGDRNLVTNLTMESVSHSVEA